MPYGIARIEGAPTAGTERDLPISEEDALFEYDEVPIEGVVPSVEHLGSALVPVRHVAADQQAAAGGPWEVVEQDLRHPEGASPEDSRRAVRLGACPVDRSRDLSCRWRPVDARTARLSSAGEMPKALARLRPREHRGGASWCQHPVDLQAPRRPGP